MRGTNPIPSTSDVGDDRGDGSPPLLFFAAAASSSLLMMVRILPFVAAAAALALAALGFLPLFRTRPTGGGRVVPRGWRHCSLLC